MLFIFFARILVIAGSAINPFIYATTILKFKEAIGNVRKSLAPVRRKKQQMIFSSTKEYKDVTDKSDNQK